MFSRELKAFISSLSNTCQSLRLNNAGDVMSVEMLEYKYTGHYEPELKFIAKNPSSFTFTISKTNPFLMDILKLHSHVELLFETEQEISYKIRKEKAASFSHDLTCCALWGSIGDMPLKLIGSYGDGYDEATPDFILTDQEMTFLKPGVEEKTKEKRKTDFILELKTTLKGDKSSFDWMSLESGKYLPAVKARARQRESKVVYLKFLISPKLCKASIRLTQDHVNKAFRAFSYGSQIMSALNIRFSNQEDEEIRRKQEIRNSLRRFEEESSSNFLNFQHLKDKDLCITQNDIKKWRQPTEAQINRESSAHLADSINRTIPLFKKDIYEENKKHWQEFEASWRRNGKIDKEHSESVIKLPFFLPKRLETSPGEIANLSCLEMIEGLQESKVNSPEREAWITSYKDLKKSFLTNEDKIKVLNPDLMNSKELEEAIRHHVGKSKSENILKKMESTGKVPSYIRKLLTSVGVKYSPQMEIQAAAKGINGKKFSKKNIDFITERHNKKKNNFYSQDHDNSDIKNFIQGDVTSETFLKKHKSSLVSQKVKNLVNHSLLNCEPEKYQRAMKIYNNLNETVLSEYLDFMSAVAQEVNLQRRFNVDQDRYIIRKMLHYNAYLIIKPTQKDKHIFFSIMAEKHVLKDQKNFRSILPFQSPVYEDDRMIVSQFRSFDKHEINHWIPIKQVAFATLIHFEFLFGEDSVDQIENCLFSLSALQHFRFILLVLMENKEETSSDLQVIRYMYMDLEKQKFSRPFKVISKFSLLVRSRLHCFILQKVLETFKISVEKLRGTQYKLESMLSSINSDDAPSHRLSWINGVPISFTQAIALSYLGTFHNKEKGETNQGFLKIFSKVIDMELELYKTINSRKKENKSATFDLKHCNPKLDNIKTHEFSAPFMCFMGDKVRAKLLSMNSKAEIEDSILKRCSEDSWLSLATIKSSSRFEPPIVYDKNVMNDRALNMTIGRRFRVIENLIVARNLLREFAYLNKLKYEESASPYTSIDLILKFHKEKESAALFATLFKKLQLGGVREIFVLSIISRIIVKFVENVCYCFNEMLPQEMMSKPEMKSKLNIIHMQNLTKKLFLTQKEKSRVISVTSSGDSKTWCQQFIMPAFGATIFRITKGLNLKGLDSAIAYVLNACTLKRLQLPNQLLNTFLKNPLNNSYDNFSPVNELKKEFTGIKTAGELLDRKGHNQLKNRSNFMQGIFHFTSSLIHAAYQEVKKDQIETYFLARKIKIETTFKCSSDDFSVITSIVAPEDKYDILMKILILFHESMREDFKLWCARVSDEKSTIGLIGNVEEFNSLWTKRGEQISVALKFIYAACQCPKTVSFEKRLQEFANARSEMLANGSYIIEIQCVSLFQSEIHYMLNGLQVSEDFEKYADLLIKLPHPIFGFYILDPSFLSGVGGWRLSLFNQLRSNEASLFIHRLLHHPGGETHDPNVVTSGLQLKFGGQKKFLDMLERLKLKINFKNEFFLSEQNCLKYLRGPKDPSDIDNLLKLQISSPQVGETLNFMNGAESAVTSVYVLSTKCFTVTNKMISDNFETLIHSESEMVRIFKEKANAKSTPSLLKELEEKINSRNLKIDMREKIQRINEGKPQDRMILLKEAERVWLLTKENVMSANVDATSDKMSLIDYMENVILKELNSYSQNAEVENQTIISNHKKQEPDIILQPWFPEHDILKQMLQINKTVSTELAPSLRKRKWKTMLPLPISSSSVSVSLTDACLWKWSGETIDSSQEQSESAWVYYKEIFPWLKDSFHETYGKNKALFSNPSSLVNFIKMSIPKMKQITVLGPSMPVHSGEVTVISIVKNCFWPGKRLRTNVELTDPTYVQLSTIEDALSKISDPISSTGDFIGLREYAHEIITLCSRVWMRRPTVSQIHLSKEKRMATAQNEYEVYCKTLMNDLINAFPHKITASEMHSALSTSPEYLKPILTFLYISRGHLNAFELQELSRFQKNRIFTLYVASNREGKSWGVSLSVISEPGNPKNVIFLLSHGENTLCAFSLTPLTRFQSLRRGVKELNLKLPEDIFDLDEYHELVGNVLHSDESSEYEDAFSILKKMEKEELNEVSQKLTKPSKTTPLMNEWYLLSQKVRYQILSHLTNQENKKEVVRDLIERNKFDENLFLKVKYISKEGIISNSKTAFSIPFVNLNSPHLRSVVSILEASKGQMIDFNCHTGWFVKGRLDNFDLESLKNSHPILENLRFKSHSEVKIIEKIRPNANTNSIFSSGLLMRMGSEMFITSLNKHGLHRESIAQDMQKVVQSKRIKIEYLKTLSLDIIRSPENLSDVIYGWDSSMPTNFEYNWVEFVKLKDAYLKKRKPINETAEEEFNKETAVSDLSIEQGLLRTLILKAHSKINFLASLDNERSFVIHQENKELLRQIKEEEEETDYQAEIITNSLFDVEKLEEDFDTSLMGDLDSIFDTVGEAAGLEENLNADYNLSVAFNDENMNEIESTIGQMIEDPNLNFEDSVAGFVSVHGHDIMRRENILRSREAIDPHWEGLVSKLSLMDSINIDTTFYKTKELREFLELVENDISFNHNLFSKEKSVREKFQEESDEEELEEKLTIIEEDQSSEEFSESDFFNTSESGEESYSHDDSIVD